MLSLSASGDILTDVHVQSACKDITKKKKSMAIQTMVLIDKLNKVKNLDEFFKHPV